MIELGTLKENRNRNTGELFSRITANHEVIFPRYDPQKFVGRQWLVDIVSQFRDDPTRRHLIIVGEPGSGKSTFIAYLAETWKCPRHFIRVDNISGVTGIDPRAFLLSIGTQLYQKYGSEIFKSDEKVKTRVTVGLSKDQAEVVGRVIEELHTPLPFLEQERDIAVKVGAALGESKVIGERVKRLVNNALSLPETTLLHIAVLQPLEKLSELFPKEKVVIFIDALDESSQHPGKSILDVIPRASDAGFPSNLRLVMTSRPGNHLVRFGNKDLLRLDDKEAGYWEETLKDARDYIDKRLSEEPLTGVLVAMSLEKLEAFIEEIETRSDGNFLYLYHFMNAVAEGFKAGETDLGEITVPADLDEIYRFFAMERIRKNPLDLIHFTVDGSIPDDVQIQLQAIEGVEKVFVAGKEATVITKDIDLVLPRLFGLANAAHLKISNLQTQRGTQMGTWEEKYLPVLGVLAVAFEALNRDQLAGFAGVEVEYVDSIVAQLLQFLDTINVDSSVRYRLYHRDFAEYLLDSTRNRDYPVKGRIFHSRIADYYLLGNNQWENVNWSLVKEDYPYVFLPLHLLAANREEEFYALINKGWMHAKLIHSHSYYSFSKDIKRAIQLAENEELLNFAQIIRLSLIQITLRSIANAVPAGLVGSLAYLNSNRAVAMAEGNAALIINKTKQATTYQMIGEAFLSRKNMELAEAKLMQAIKITKEITNEYDQSAILRSLTRAVIKLNNKKHLQELLNTVSTLRDHYLKVSALAYIARMLADAGKREYGFEVVEKASSITKLFSDDSRSYLPYARIAVALDHLKEKRKAEEAADLSISSAKSHPESLNDVTNILLDLTDPQKAIEAVSQTQLVLETFPEGMTKLENRSILAKNLARIGSTEKAISNAEWVLNTISLYEHNMAGYQSYALSEIAQAFAILGEKEKALTVTNKALAASKEIGRLDPKLDALILGIIPSAVLIQSQNLLMEVLESIGESIGFQRWEISEVLHDYGAICGAMVELGSLDGLKRALQIALEIEDNWRRIAACGTVAQYMIKLGDEEEALRIAEQIFADAEELFGNESDKKLCQGAIAMIYAQRCTQEKIPSLVNVTETLGTGYKTATLATIALRLSQQGEEKWANELVDQVSKLIDSFRNVSVRATMLLICLFQTLVKLGREEELSRLTKKLETQTVNPDIGEFILKVVRFAIIPSKDYQSLDLSTEIMESLENQRRIELNGSSGRWVKWERGPILRVLITKFFELGFTSQWVEIVDQSIADSEVNEKNPYEKAAALNKAAIALSAAGRQRESQLKLVSALVFAREWSRNTIFRAVEQNTETLVAIDQGETLWKIFEVIQEIDSWWKTK